MCVVLALGGAMARADRIVHRGPGSPVAVADRVHARAGPVPIHLRAEPAR